MNYHVSDSFSVGVHYATRGRQCCVVHSVEVPVVYRRGLDEVAYLMVGSVPSFGEHPEMND